MSAVDRALAVAVLEHARVDGAYAADLARVLADALPATARPAVVPDVLTVPEAADYLRCSRQRIYNLRSSGRLTRLGDGRSAKVRRRDLDALLAAAAGGVVR